MLFTKSNSQNIALAATIDERNYFNSDCYFYKFCELVKATFYLQDFSLEKQEDSL